MHDSETSQPAPNRVEALKRILEQMQELDRTGRGVTDLLRQARKLARGLPAGPVPTSAVAGYLLKARSTVFYPTDMRPTDIDNFHTLVFAEGAAPTELEAHYVVRYVERVGGALGKEHGLVPVRDWEAGMSRAVAEQVCDSAGQPLVVYPGPKTSTGSERGACS
jgi:hypothetical protein